MEYAYAKATDVAVVTGLIAGGTDGGNRTLDAADFLISYPMLEFQSIPTLLDSHKISSHHLSNGAQSRI